MGDVFSALTAAVGAADKVLELIHRKPEMLPEGTLVPEKFEGSIEMRDVHFAYPPRPDTQVRACRSLLACLQASACVCVCVCVCVCARARVSVHACMLALIKCQQFSKLPN